MKNIDLKPINEQIDNLYNALHDFIKDNGGYICTYAPKGKSIYSVEFVGGDNSIAEWNVLGLAIDEISDEIIYCADYDALINEDDLDENGKVSMEYLEECFEWFRLRYSDNYYIQTLYNICEMVEDFV